MLKNTKSILVLLLSLTLITMFTSCKQNEEKKAEPKAAVNAAVKVVPEKKVDAAVPAKEAVEVAEAKKGEDVVLNQTYGQAEVKVGNTTICPVMGSKFKVKDDTQFVTVKGKKVFICCAGCKEPLETDPDKYLKK